MSDKRAMYAIGAFAATFALVLGLITAVPVSSVTTLNSAPLGFMGHAEVVLKDIDGNIKAYQQSDNVVVLNGQDCAADLIFGIFEGGLCAGAAQAFDHIDIGSGDTAADDQDTTLETPLGLTRTGELTAEDDATTGGGGTGAIKTITGTFILTAPSDVKEVGLFDDVTSPGEMFSRIVLGSPISAGTGDTVTITYKITVG